MTQGRQCCPVYISKEGLVIALYDAACFPPLWQTFCHFCAGPLGGPAPWGDGRMKLRSLLLASALTVASPLSGLAAGAPTPATPPGPDQGRPCPPARPRLRGSPPLPLG